MNEAYLIFIATIAFGAYCLWQNLKAIKAISKILPAGIKYKYKLSTRLKSLLLNKKHWDNEISGKHIDAFTTANTYWRSYVKRILIAFIGYAVLLSIAMIPSIIYLINN